MLCAEARLSAGMAMIEWKPEYSVSIESFDSAHKWLFTLMNELSDAMAAGRGRFEVQRILHELAVYCDLHFSDEENAMRTCGFAGLAEHQEEHRKLTAQVQKLASAPENPVTVAIDLLNLLKEWLTQHILVADRKYIEPLKRYRNPKWTDPVTRHVRLVG